MNPLKLLAFIQTPEQICRASKIACIEELLSPGYINGEQLIDFKPLPKSGYGRYLMDAIDSDIRTAQVWQIHRVIPFHEILIQIKPP